MGLVAPRHMGSLFPNQRSNPCSLHCKEEIVNHWTIREVPTLFIINILHFIMPFELEEINFG